MANCSPALLPTGFPYCASGLQAHHRHTGLWECCVPPYSQGQGLEHKVRRGCIGTGLWVGTVGVAVGLDQVRRSWCKAGILEAPLSLWRFNPRIRSLPFHSLSHAFGFGPHEKATAPGPHSSEPRCRGCVYAWRGGFWEAQEDCPWPKKVGNPRERIIF